MASLRPIDHAQEQINTTFLYKHFYQDVFPGSTMITIKEMQLRGCDVEVPNGRSTCYHDIKTQASKKYINNPLPTFAMEILFDSSGQERTGWFVRNDLLTDVYCLCWIPKARVNADGYLDSDDDIEEMEVMLIEKQRLINYVSKIVPQNRLIGLAQHMRETNTKRLEVSSGLHMIYSDFLEERPVNLVIKKFLLEKLATSHWKVTPNGAIKI